MRLLTLLFVLALSTQVFASTCNVYNYKSAIRCIEKWSMEQEGVGEMPNTVGVTRKAKGRKAFEKITGVVPKATYVGVAEIHYDEDILLYVELEVGEGVSPKLVKSTSSPDIYNEHDLEDDAPQSLVDLYRLYIHGLKDFHL